METKKKNSKNMDRYKTLFFEAGLVVSLFVVLSAFEWKKYDNNETSLYNQPVYDIPEDIVAITRPESEPPRPQPQTTVLDIVDDQVDVQDDLDINMEDDQNTVADKFVTFVDNDEPIQIDDGQIFQIVEDQPSFPDGESALMNYLGSNIKYPQLARETNIQGTVYVTFVVESTGSISNVQVLHGIGGGCDEEAVRVVKNMPTWIPGKQRGKPVRVQFNLPIRFILKS